ncbi:C-type lectin domain family 4 member A-like [Xiphophorus couchianus]|uniref:C-type lectin domain family 4 member A-like n=1 Tax=Xiphophorus couchianus TaxID=32473 RepID=UPI0010163F12|nr:C-type lectin domain family 4 member A-like [Xiphophorus couchianus]
MPEADVTYADVKFTTPRSRGNVAAEDSTYSEVKISNKQQPVYSNCSANIQQSGSSRRSKVTPERLVLLGLVVLLAAALIALGVTFVQTNQNLQTLKEEKETLKKNLSNIKPGSKSSTTACPTCPTCPAYPTCPACPPPPPTPAVKRETFLKCEAGWEKHGGNCYYFSTSKSSWINSRRSCVDLGSDLVKIDSREEQLFLEIRLRGLMMKDTDKFWIGLTDSVEEGKWFWVDGSPLDESLSFWSQKEPDDWKNENPAGEDCVRMGERGGSHDLTCWFDKACNVSHKSICEKPAAPGRRCV